MRNPCVVIVILLCVVHNALATEITFKAAKAHKAVPCILHLASANAASADSGQLLGHYHNKLSISSNNETSTMQLMANFEGTVQASYVLTSTDGMVLSSGEVRIPAGLRTGRMSMQQYSPGEYILTMMVRSKVTKASATYIYRIKKEAA